MFELALQLVIMSSESPLCHYYTSCHFIKIIFFLSTLCLNTRFIDIYNDVGFCYMEKEPEPLFSVSYLIAQTNAVDTSCLYF